MTIVEGDPKAPFSIATTPRCRGGRYSFPWIAPLYPWSLPYNAVLSKVASSTIFWVFGMTQTGIEPRSPGSLANNLTLTPLFRQQLINHNYSVWSSWGSNGFGFVSFYGIKTTIDYFGPNSYHKYILNIWLIFLNEPELNGFTYI